ncbi:MAG: short-chain dehydrogenase [Solirubrobacterales bacterium]|nr:short-chain dehydrogenase [Solirubrobacterales bacterium]
MADLSDAQGVAVVGTADNGDARGVAVVVGGASGIGLACRRALDDAGWTTIAADLKPGDDPRDVAVDVRDHDALTQAADRIAAEHGPIGAVVYAAGMARVTPLMEIAPREWELVLGVNLSGGFHTLRACVPHMVPGASLVFISSVDSQSPVPGLAHYSAAKAGIEALVRSAALELGGRGLRVNAVLPGVVRTPLMAPMLARPDVASAFIANTPLGRIAEGDDIAAVVTFLVSDAARWVTGVALPVDGGMSLREHPQLLEA